MNLIESLIAVSLLAFISCSTPQYFVMICHRTQKNFDLSRAAVNDFSLREAKRVR